MVTQAYLQKYHMDYISGSESLFMLVAIHTFRCSPVYSPFQNNISKFYIGL